MGPHIEKQYLSVDTSEELGIITNSMSELELESENVAVDLTTASSPPTSRLARTCSPITDYLLSYRSAEMVFCLSFFLVTNTTKLLHFTPVYQRPIPVQYLETSQEFVVDLSHDHKPHGETVPFEILFLVSGVMPLALQVLLSMCKRLPFKAIHEVHQTLCVYFCTWSLNIIAVGFVKNYVGYLRPFFYQLCRPTEDFSECTAGGHGMRRSFPSGHAATSFAGMTLLALYIHNRWGVHSKRIYQQVVVDPTRGKQGMEQQQPRFRLTYQEDVGLPLARLMSIIALLPLFVALWIAASRVRDDKHFPADVLAGALIGSSLATYSHGMWFV